MNNLTRDAVAARAEGISYGKYKGRQYEQMQKEKAKEEQDRKERRAKREAEKAAQVQVQKNQRLTVCVWCGREFWAIPPVNTCCQACKDARTFERGKIGYYRRKGEPVPLEVQYMLEQMKNDAIEKRKMQEEGYEDQERGQTAGQACVCKK